MSEFIENAILLKRNIELTQENAELREKIEQWSKGKNKAYKDLWLEHQEALQKLTMINEFTQNLTKVYPCG